MHPFTRGDRSPLEMPYSRMASSRSAFLVSLASAILISASVISSLAVTGRSGIHALLIALGQCSELQMSSPLAFLHSNSAAITCASGLPLTSASSIIWMAVSVAIRGECNCFAFTDDCALTWVDQRSTSSATARSAKSSRASASKPAALVTSLPEGPAESAARIAASSRSLNFCSSRSWASRLSDCSRCRARCSCASCCSLEARISVDFLIIKPANVTEAGTRGIIH